MQLNSEITDKELANLEGGKFEGKKDLTADFILQKLTFLEKICLNNQIDNSRKIEIPRYLLICGAAGLSSFFYMLKIFSASSGMIFHCIIVSLNHEHKLHSAKQVDILEYHSNLIQNEFLFFIATLQLIFFMHSIEKYLLNNIQNTNYQDKFFFVRKKISDNPVSAYICIQLLFSLVSRYRLESNSNLTLDDFSIIGLSCFGALCSIFKILKEDYLKLSYCFNLVSKYINKIHEQISLNIDCSKKIHETIARPINKCVNIVTESFYAKSIKSYLNESTVDSHDFTPSKIV